jgi:hypothetical protein
MIGCVRQIAFGAALALAGAGAPAVAASQVVQINATVAKPLSLSRLQDLDLGTITLKPGTWSGATVAISQAGALNCANANVVCTGATQPAKYNVQGTNKTVVRITAPNVTLVNQRDPTKSLTLVLDSPASVTLTSSGVPGVDFAIGGSVSLSSAAADGTYAGTFNVTVDY